MQEKFRVLAAAAYPWPHRPEWRRATAGGARRKFTSPSDCTGACVPRFVLGCGVCGSLIALVPLREANGGARPWLDRQGGICDSLMMSEDTLIAAFASPVFLRHCGASDLTREASRPGCATWPPREPSDDAKRAHQGGYYSKGTLFSMDWPGNGGIAPADRHARWATMSSGWRRAAARRASSLIGWVAHDPRAGDYQTPHVHAGATPQWRLLSGGPGKTGAAGLHRPSDPASTCRR